MWRERGRERGNCDKMQQEIRTQKRTKKKTKRKKKRKKRLEEKKKKKKERKKNKVDKNQAYKKLCITRRFSKTGSILFYRLESLVLTTSPTTLLFPLKNRKLELTSCNKMCEARRSSFFSLVDLLINKSIKMPFSSICPEEVASTYPSF